MSTMGNKETEHRVARFLDKLLPLLTAAHGGDVFFRRGTDVDRRKSLAGHRLRYANYSVVTAATSKYCETWLSRIGDPGCKLLRFAEPSA